MTCRGPHAGGDPRVAGPDWLQADHNTHVAGRCGPRALTNAVFRGTIRNFNQSCRARNCIRFEVRRNKFHGIPDERRAPGTDLITSP